MSALNKGKFLMSALALLGALLLWRGAASADSLRFNLFLGSPPPPVVVYEYPRVVYPQPVIVEAYPVYYYHYYRGVPSRWVPAHGRWKKHEHPRVHRHDHD